MSKTRARSGEFSETIGQTVQLPLPGQRGCLGPRRRLVMQARERRGCIQGCNRAIETQFLGLRGKLAIRQRVLERFVFAQKAGRALRAHSLRTRQLVRRVATERYEVGYLPGLDAVPLANFRRPDARHFTRPHRLEYCRRIRNQLEGVAVTARHNGGPVASLLAGDGGREKVIGLVAGSFRAGETAGSHELWQDIELINQSRIELAPTLVGCQRPVTIRRCIERIPADQHRSGLLGLEKPQQEIRESHDCAAAHIAAPTYGLRECVIGAMCERVAVDDEEWSAHEALQIWVTARRIAYKMPPSHQSGSCR